MKRNKIIVPHRFAPFFRTLTKINLAFIALNPFSFACNDQSVEYDISSTKRRLIDGREFIFVKKVDSSGRITSFAFDDVGQKVDPSLIPHVIPQKVGPRLQAILDRNPSEDSTIDVLIGLHQPTLPSSPEPLSFGSASIDTEGGATVTLNGIAATDRTIEKSNQITEAHLRNRLILLEEARSLVLRELGARHPKLAESPAMRRAMARGASSVELSLTSSQISELLTTSDDLIAALELRDKPIELLDTAMEETNIDPYAMNYSNRGNGIGIYMSEEFCPDNNFLPKYKRLSGSTGWHSKVVSSIIRGVSPDSYIYCRDGFMKPTSADLSGANPPIYVENHSWGYESSGVSIDDEVYSDDIRWSDLEYDDHVYDTQRFVVFSAGNNGAKQGKTPYVGSPGKALNVLTVGNYVGSWGAMNSNSSWQNSEIGNEKPEVVAPGTNIYVNAITDNNNNAFHTGTSFAAPHVAGFAANLMSTYPILQGKPFVVKSLIMSSADKNITEIAPPGDSSRGVGGVNYLRTFGTQLQWFSGGNSSFSSFDSGDYLGSNGYVDVSSNLDSTYSNVRVVLVWATRGTYTHAHRLDPHPIGIDLDLCVFDPNGVQVGCSVSYDNPYEMVEFNPTISGNYRIRIHEADNRDSLSDLRFAVSINWTN